MYGLPEDVDLSFLLNSQLLKLRRYEWNLILEFDAPVEINIESRALFSHAGNVSEWVCGCSEKEVVSNAMVGATIVSFSATRSGTLEIDFSNGSKLSVFDNSKEFESYTISGPGLTVVV